MTNKSKYLFLALPLLFSLSCALLQPTPAAIAPTLTVGADTIRPSPIEPPVPSDIPIPTDTPAPTSTPTVQPSPTIPLLPTTIPTFPPDFPVAFTGTGDKVLDITPWGPGIMTIIANQPKDNFIVQSHDQTGEPMDLVINMVGELYIGVLPINWENRKASMLQVKANPIGAWSVTFEPIYSDKIASVDIPGSYNGDFDSAFRLNNFTSGIATFTSQGEDNFVVQAFNNNLEYLDLLVNEIGDYSGTVILPPGTAYLTINAAGPWTIQVGSK